MNKKEVRELFDRYTAGLCTPEERAMVERWYQQQADGQEFPSDCSDIFGSGEGCTGAQAIAAIRKLSPTKEIERKILYNNAVKLLRLQ